MLTAWDEQNHRDRAVELLGKASLIFDELDMRPFLQQAAQVAKALHYELSLPSRPVPAEERTEAANAKLQVIFFSDIVGSTDLLRRLGDVRAQEVTRAHNAIIRACLRQHDGIELQQTGDGFMVSFASASGAMACALAIHRALAEHNRLDPKTSLQVRIGLHAGEPLPEEGRLFGAAVNAAARICAQARGGEVLVSEAVRQLAVGKGFTFVDRGLFELKGFEEPFRLYAILEEGQGA
jgi:adenylate cyclase